MHCLAHISDLHLGCAEAELAEGLLRDLREQKPSLVAISGDFTQRARRSQFKASQQFISQLQAPWIGVPGNHDVPFYDVIRRFLWPLNRYRKFVTADLNPYYEKDDLMLLGINTARSLTWKSGRISYKQIELIRSRLGSKRPNTFKVVMTHHPFIPPPGDEISGIDLVGRAALAIPVLDECCVDLLLAGHLHQGYSGNVATHYPAAKRTMISVQAGTAISKRTRHEPNAYNLIRLDRDEIVIEIRLWRDRAFTKGQVVRYKLTKGEWALAENKTATAA